MRKEIVDILSRIKNRILARETEKLRTNIRMLTIFIDTRNKIKIFLILIIITINASFELDKI